MYERINTRTFLSTTARKADPTQEANLFIAANIKRVKRKVVGVKLMNRASKSSDPSVSTHLRGQKPTKLKYCV